MSCFVALLRRLKTEKGARIDCHGLLPADFPVLVRRCARGAKFSFEVLPSPFVSAAPPARNFANAKHFAAPGARCFGRCLSWPANPAPH
jgi:hypothetical protein